MQHLETEIRTNSAAKVKQKGKADNVASPIRVKAKTREKIDDLLRLANKQKLGRKVKTDDLISYCLDLLTDDHLAEICNKTLTNKDRLEILFRKKSKERKGLTRDEFFGFLIDGKLTV